MDAPKQLIEYKELGYKWACLDCNMVYTVKPTQSYNGGRGRRLITVCKCGSFLFISLDGLIESLGGLGEKAS